MEKLERSTKYYGSGSGSQTYFSDMFNVDQWKMSKGIRTVLYVSPARIELVFDGHHDFKSDDDCLVQLNIEDIKLIIKTAKETAFRAGKKFKAQAIKKALYISDPYEDDYED